jgi:colicin import membrane protein
LGQLNRSFTGTLDKMAVGKSRYEEADKAATARVKQKGAAAIGKYYSSSDGKYYGNYKQATDARKERLDTLAKEQAAAKEKAKAAEEARKMKLAAEQEAKRKAAAAAEALRLKTEAAAAAEAAAKAAAAKKSESGAGGKGSEAPSPSIPKTKECARKAEACGIVA